MDACQNICVWNPHYFFRMNGADVFMHIQLSAWGIPLSPEKLVIFLIIHRMYFIYSNSEN